LKKVLHQAYAHTMEFKFLLVTLHILGIKPKRLNEKSLFQGQRSTMGESTWLVTGWTRLFTPTTLQPTFLSVVTDIFCPSVYADRAASCFGFQVLNLQ
jgi:hypothetical protein